MDKLTHKGGCDYCIYARMCVVRCRNKARISYGNAPHRRLSIVGLVGSPAVKATVVEDLP